MKRVSLICFSFGFLLADEIQLTPFIPSSKWHPVPEGLVAGRSGDAIVLQSSSEELLMIGQKGPDSGPGIMLRIDSVTGPPGSRAAVTLRDRIETPYIAGATLYINPEGGLGVTQETWEPYLQNLPEEPMAFPFWTQISWGANGGFVCAVSQDKVTWQEIVSFPITFPPAAYDLAIQSSKDGEEACAVFSEVTLLGGDANDNGITDGWEVQNFGRVLKIADSDDPDSDGRNNRQEWLDLTDPTEHDQPIVHTLTKMENGVRLHLSKVVYYGINFERSRDLITWELVPYFDYSVTNNFSDDTTVVDFVSENSQTLFYRTKHTPRIDPDPHLLFPPTWE